MTRLYFGQVDDCTGPASAEQTQIILPCSWTVTNFSLWHANWNASLGFFAVPPDLGVNLQWRLLLVAVHWTTHLNAPDQQHAKNSFFHRGAHTWWSLGLNSSTWLQHTFWNRTEVQLPTQWCRARSKTRSTLIISPLNIHLVVLHTGFVVYGGDWREYFDEMNWWCLWESHLVASLTVHTLTTL